MLYNNYIHTIKQLSSYSQKKFTQKGIAWLYIKDIIIALQCNGYDLRRNNCKK